VSQYSRAVNATSTIHLVSHNWHGCKAVRFITDFPVTIKGTSIDSNIQYRRKKPQNRRVPMVFNRKYITFRRMNFEEVP
jgi:hypothetical protein